jgi:cytochrome c
MIAWSQLAFAKSRYVKCIHGQKQTVTQANYVSNSLRSIEAMKISSLAAVLGATAISLMAMTSAHAAVDVEAAKALSKKNDCTKCHAPDKTKKGPSLKSIADKYRGKADGQEKAIKNMTTGGKVKLEDGTEEEHKVIDTKDQAQLKNLADWILSH